VVIQADTLWTLAKNARELSDRLRSGKRLPDAVDEAEALAERADSGRCRPLIPEHAGPRAL
jgi:hypothetical protein